VSDPRTAGPNGDGSQSLARESKFGQFANGAVVVLVTYAALALGEVDFTPLPDYLEPIVVATAGTVAGLLTAWATRNRKLPAARAFERG
jgi:hypothetical protein